MFYKIKGHLLSNVCVNIFLKVSTKLRYLSQCVKGFANSLSITLRSGEPQLYIFLILNYKIYK